MSYISKRGAEVEESINKSEKDYSKVLKSFKSGTTYKVRLLSDTDYAEYFSHSAFKVFYTTIHYEGDLYCKARKIIFAEADQTNDEKQKEALMNMAKALKPQPRYMFGFGLVAGEGAGEQIVLDLTKKQAKGVIAAIKKFASKKDMMAFEISKSGSSTDTTVSIMPVLDDLSDAEQKAFDSFNGKEFAFDNFENVFSANDEEQQVKDLTALGFDVKKLNGSSQSASEDAEKKEEYDF